MSAYVHPADGRWHVARWSAPGFYKVACTRYGSERTYAINGVPVAFEYDPPDPICRRCVNRITSEADAVTALADRNEARR